MPASISSNTIVAPPPTAAIARAMRDSSPPDAVSATGESGNPRLGRIRNAISSAPAGPGPSARVHQLDLELALPEADAGQFGCDRVRERRRGVAPGGGSARASPPTRSSAAASSSAAAAARSPPCEPVELGRRLGSPLQQLLVARAAEPPLRVRDRVEPRLDLFAPAGIGIQRRQEGPQGARGLAEAELDVTQLVARPTELGREPLDPGNGAFG